MNRRGWTLIELLIGMLVFGVVLGSAVAAFRNQSQAFLLGTQRAGTLQNVRYVVNLLDQELRTVGSGVPDEQPYVVYADDDVVAFNANFVSNVVNDIFAVYIDPDAPAGTVSALTKGSQITVPNSSFVYPDTTYRVAGSNSPAETIVFFFRPDSSTARPDDYGLFRQVNQDPPQLVARNLLTAGNQPFFAYVREVTQVGGARAIQPVSGAALPLSHAVAMHGAAADTAGVALVDSLRGVRVSVRATNGFTDARERTRELTRLIRLPNAGLSERKTCGDEPLPVAGFTALGVTLATGDPAVNLVWPQAIDEGGGEADAMRYVIYRRPAGQPTWGDPLLSIPVGNGTYLYQDLVVNSGDVLQYGLAVQDCTPSLSRMATAGPVVVP